MLTLRRRRQRRYADPGFPVDRRNCSLSGYYDPEPLGNSHLRVLTEVWVAPGAGFAPHFHQNMEIISYLLEGGLAHRDSTGHGAVLSTGEIQRMSAGSGITHSEHNVSETNPLRFLQIWIEPNQNNISPGYQQRYFPESARRNRLCLVASPDGRCASLTVHQDVTLYNSLLQPGETVRHTLVGGRSVQVYVAHGTVVVNAAHLAGGDSATVWGKGQVVLRAVDTAEVLLFDLASRDLPTFC
jgi:redox-sensitive bicupin YhaK (pirin superfamily)